MKGIILAAGMASRMWPLTKNRPKCLLPAGDKTILQRMIDNLHYHNINDILIVSGYLSKQIKDFIKATFPGENICFIHNEKFDSTNNIYSLWLAEEFVANDDFILLDSDIIFDKRIIGLLLDSPYENCLALKSTHKLGDEEIKVLPNADKSIAEISKQVNPSQAIGESIGIEKFSKDFNAALFKILDKKIIGDKNVNIFYEAAFQDAIDKGKKIFPVDVGTLPCMEIDTVEDLDTVRSKIIPLLDTD